MDDGDSIENFLEGYPAVTLEQAESVIHWEQNQARRTFGLDLANQSAPFRAEKLAHV
jgi:hypothetical protein